MDGDEFEDLDAFRRTLLPGRLPGRPTGRPRSAEGLGRAPMRKYLDKDRTQVNPDWLEWRDAQRGDLARVEAAFVGYPPEILWPDEHGKDLGDGAWILVIEVPVTALEWDVPLLSMWRARPHRLNVGGVRGVRPYQAVISTPAGDLHLWPHEYVIVTDPVGLMGEDGAEIHTLGGDPALDVDHLFYLQSRGIPRVEAVRLLAESMTALDYCYVTFPADVVEALEGWGRPLWRSIQLAEARRAMDERTVSA